jgi:hypothetical protein
VTEFLDAIEVRLRDDQHIVAGGEEILQDGDARLQMLWCDVVRRGEHHPAVQLLSPLGNLRLSHAMVSGAPRLVARTLAVVHRS